MLELYFVCIANEKKKMVKEKSNYVYLKPSTVFWFEIFILRHFTMQKLITRWGNKRRCLLNLVAEMKTK